MATRYYATVVIDFILGVFGIERSAEVFIESPEPPTRDQLESLADRFAEDMAFRGESPKAAEIAGLTNYQVTIESIFRAEGE